MTTVNDCVAEPSTKSTTLEILTEARRILTPGKATLTFVDGNGYRCTAMAIAEAVGEDPVQIEARHPEVMRALGVVVSVCIWNNRHTHAEILEAFDSAIACASGRRHLSPDNQGLRPRE